MPPRCGASPPDHRRSYRGRSASRHARPRLARDLARSDRAAVYGRTGSCLGRNATLVAFLLDALNLVTGNLDREGGAMFGDPPIDFSRVADMAGLGTYAKVRSRVGDLPEVLGSLPASVMAKEMRRRGVQLRRCSSPPATRSSRSQRHELEARSGWL